MTIDEVEVAHPDLIATVRSWDLQSSLIFCSALLLCPELHVYTFAIEVLIHSVCVHAAGQIQPSRIDVREAIGKIHSFLEPSEETPRDVFVVNVMTGQGNRRFLTGTWETPEFWVQQALDALDSAPDREPFNTLREQLAALLSFSDSGLARCGLSRYAPGVVSAGDSLELPSEEQLSSAINVVRVENRLPENLTRAFAIDLTELRTIGGDRLGNTRLEHRPLVLINPSLSVWALPTAISIAVRTYLLKQMLQTANLKSFSRALHIIQARSFVDLLRGHEFESSLHAEFPGTPDTLRWVRQTAVRFEAGKIAHVVLLHDDLHEAAKQGLTTRNTSGLRSFLDFQTYLSRSIIRLHFGLKKQGMTVIILAGLGRGFALPPFAQPHGWPVCVLNLSDAVALMWLQRNWLNELWSVKGDIRMLSENGLHIRDDGDDARVLGYWRAKDRIVPLEQGMPAENVHVNIDRTFAVSFRAETRFAYDEHASYRPSTKSWVRVAKLAGLGHFGELRKLPIYASISDAINRKLLAVVETSERSWWVELQPMGENPDLHLAYVIWDAAVQWCGRVLPLAERAARGLGSGSIEIKIEVQIPSASEILEMQSANELIDVASNRVEQRIRLMVRSQFFQALAEPTNKAERQLVSAVLRGISALQRTPLPEADLLEGVIPNDKARFAHLFRAQNYRDQLSDLPVQNAWLLSERDSYNACLGVSAALRFPGRQTLAAAHSQEFLHSAVDLAFSHVRNQLQRFSRESTVITVLRNLEAIGEDDTHWRKTAAALLGVYKDQDDVLAAALQQNSARARTALTSRILVEMAVCESPTNGGAELGRYEYMRLIASVHVLVLAAYNSDAIKYGLAEPILDVWPNGEFAISRTFEEAILHPYQAGRFRDDFKKSAADYDDLFLTRQEKSVQEVFPSEFIAAWEHEFGFTIEHLLALEGVLLEKALATKGRVQSITTEELCAALEKKNLPGPAIKQIVELLILTPRRSWASPPPGFQLRDIEPWRFGRRLSLLRRPLVQVDDNRFPETKICYAAGFVHDSFAFTVGSAYAGTMHEKSFTSSDMRRWIGAVNNKNGTEFNEAVRALAESTGLRARCSIRMKEFDRDDLGDIDVLAWNESRDMVIIIECKHLRFARTVGEIAEQLRRFQGQPGDELSAHIGRIKWLMQHPGKVKKKLNLHDHFRLRQLLVTERLVPMAFVERLPIPPETVVSANCLASVLKEGQIGEVFRN